MKRPACGLARAIETRLARTPVPGLPALSLYTAHPASRLSQIADGPPYWAFPWAGGLALAHHLAAHPEVVHGRRVLDLGAGSGLVAIAAAKAGACDVQAAETDATGAAAIALNTAMNGVRVEIIAEDLLGHPPPAVDIVVAGDVFYAPDLAVRVMPFLIRCRDAGLDVLIGDPERRALPLPQLRMIAAYDVVDFGRVPQDARVIGKVFRLR